MKEPSWGDSMGQPDPQTGMLELDDHKGPFQPKPSVTL